MQLPSQGSTMEVDGDFAPSDFGIAISAHAFNVLSKGLYSDPFRAIVRELCCNAWDAHVEAGTTDRPFELCLPNTIAPIFKIRDYGVGLSEESIYKIYKTYFVSTKQQSDEMTGCFGLGSKSPYAYTKKFTVVSFFNGTRFHYNCIINEKGFPQILKMAETPTTEHNGLEVAFSVNEDDFEDFERAAKIALRPFVVKPIVRGSADFEPALYPGEPLLQGKGWKLFHDLDGGNICSMGNVEYPIEVTRKGFSSNAKKVLGLSIVVDFPLGSFEMTPSRESIQWTEFSVQNINDRLEQIYEEIVVAVSKAVEDSQTYWEAVVNAATFFDGTGLRELKIQPMWRGKLVKGSIDLPIDKGITVFKFTAIEPRANSSAKNSASINKMQKIDPVATTFYLSDFSGAEYRLGNFVRDTFDRGHHAYLVSVADNAALKTFCHTVGISEKSLVMASTVPKRVQKGRGGAHGQGGRRSKLAGSKARAFTFDMTASGNSDAFWQEAEIDLEAPDLGVYVEISRWNPEGSRYSKANDLKYALHYLKGIGVPLPDGGLVGIKTAHKGKFEEHDNWKTFDSFVREKVLEVWMGNADFRYAYEFFKVMHYEERNTIISVRSMATMLGKGLLPSDSYLIRFAKAFDRIYKWEKYVSPFDSLRVALTADPDYGMSLVLPHGNPEKNREVYSRRVTAQYPLMKTILKSGGYSGYSADKATQKAVAEYIQLMDQKSRANSKPSAKPVDNN